MQRLAYLLKPYLSQNSNLLVLKLSFIGVFDTFFKFTVNINKYHNLLIPIRDYTKRSVT